MAVTKEVAQKEKLKAEEQPQLGGNKGALTTGTTNAKMTVEEGIEFVRHQFDEKANDIGSMLPSDISWELFRNTISYALSKNPKLLSADRRSLLNAGIEAAQDGLLPDGREGVFNIYRVKISKKNEKDKWIDAVKWMPMIKGLTKKILETGQVKEFRTRVVYAKDKFALVYGDEERLTHEPSLDEDPGPIVACYCILKKHNGGIEREVMTRRQIEQVKAVSKAQTGPWGDWYDEMGRKSVARRLIKRVPLTQEIERILERDDGNYDLGIARKKQEAITAPNAPAMPKREDFQDGGKLIEGTANEEETESSAVEVGNALLDFFKNATTKADLAGAWEEANRSGDLSAIAEGSPDLHKQICETYNGRSVEFDKAKPEADKPAEGKPAQEEERKPAQEDEKRQQDDDGGNTNDSAPADERSEDEEQEQADYVKSSLDKINEMVTAKALNNWFNLDFKKKAETLKLSETAIGIVSDRLNAKLKGMGK